MNRRSMRWIFCVLLAGGLIAAIGLADKTAAAEKIKVLVLTGGHGLNEKEFPDLFKGYDDIVATQVAQKDGGAAFDNIDNWSYDVIVLYNFGQKINEKQQANFLKLMDRGVGLFVLHHAMGAYPDWPEYKTIAGGKFYTKPVQEGKVKHGISGFKHDLDIKVHVADAEHPITKGLTDYTIHDETYKNYWIDPKARVLLTTDDPTSDKVLAWTKTYRKSKVFGLEHGHDEKAWVNPNFRALVSQGIRWTAGRL